MIRWEEATIKRYETWKQERIRLLVHVFVTQVSQILLISLLFRGVSRSFNLQNIVIANIDLGLIASKGICGIVLHLAMSSNMTQGNEMMKYALNHHMRFLSFTNAFWLGVTRSVTTFLVETISMIIVFQSATVTDVVFNFIALAVIDDFDIFVYESLRSSSFKSLLEEDH